MYLQRPLLTAGGHLRGALLGFGRERRRRVVAVTVVAALAASAGILTATVPASAAYTVSVSNGTFLSGSVLGVDLATLVSLQKAAATNTGATGLVSQVHPLSVNALSAVNVSLGSGINLLGQNGVLALGAVNQYAQAKSDGSSLGATGAVTNTGAIGVGGQSGVPQSNATLNLTSLLGPTLTSTVADLHLTVGSLSAVARQAAGAGGAQTGDYGIAGLSLSLDSPALAGTTTSLRSSLVALQPTVDGLQQTLNGLLLGTVTINGLPNLGGLVDALTTVTSADGSITANLQTGAITIDVAKLLASQGLDLNNLPANTELAPYITTGLTTQLLPAVTTALTGIVTQVTNSLQNLTLTVLGLPVQLGSLLQVVAPVITAVTAPVSAAVAGLGAGLVTPLATGLTSVVSLQANVHQQAAGVFTERALGLTLLPGTTPLAVVNLASASVGPNPGPAGVPTATSLTPTHGPVSGGTAVTVAGSGFDGSSTVTVGGFGPITPTATSDDGTSLTFTTPAHSSGSEPVVVTTTAGSTPPLTFTYDATPPTAASLAPTNGPAAGGTAVTVAGTGFDSSSTVTIGGFGPITPTTIASDGTSVTFTTPAHSPGGVPVVVTAAGGSTTPRTFTYDPAVVVAPTTTGLAPDHGPVAGGTSVTVTGAGFDSRSTVSIGGFGPITPSSIAGLGTSLVFTTPAHAAGGAPVVVTTTSGSSGPQTYTFTSPTPTSTSLDPAHGPSAGGTTVTVVGTGFGPESTVTVDGGAAITPASVASDGTSLTFITPAHAAGGVPVVVTTSAGDTAPLTYTFDAVVPGAPTATELSPTHGPVVGGTSVTITGTGFDPAATVSIDGGAPITPGVIAPDGTTLTFTTPAHAAGPVTVTVAAVGGSSGPLTFIFDTPAATATGLNPNHGPIAGNTSVTITGTNFDSSSRVSVDASAPITPTSVAGDGTSLTFLTPAHVADGVPVTVTGTTGTTSPLTFTYDAQPAPTETGLSPSHGPVEGGTVVTITGTGFDSTSRVWVDGGGPITPDSVLGNGTSLTFTTPPHVVAAVAIAVSGAAGTTTSLTFTYDPAPAPRLTGMNPTHGPVAGGTTVTIAGTRFDSNSRVSVDGSGPITPDSVASNGTSLSFTTPAHIVGAVSVTATTSAGTTGPLPYAYDAATENAQPSDPSSPVDPAANPVPVLALTGSPFPVLPFIVAMLMLVFGVGTLGTMRIAPRTRRVSR